MKGNPAATILRWGLAFVFFYAAVSSLRHPENWIIFLPGFLTGFISAHLLIVGLALYELILAIWLFTGKKLAVSSLLAMATLGGVAIANFEAMDIVFRDVGLAFAALALFELSRGDAFREEGSA